MSRYQLFLEDAEGDGCGELAECDTLGQVWAFIDQRMDDTPGRRAWWLKDREEEQFAAAWVEPGIWQAQAETPGAFVALLDCIHGWLIPPSSGGVWGGVRPI